MRGRYLYLLAGLAVVAWSLGAYLHGGLGRWSWGRTTDAWQAPVTKPLDSRLSGHSDERNIVSSVADHSPVGETLSVGAQLPPARMINGSRPEPSGVDAKGAMAHVDVNDGLVIDRPMPDTVVIQPDPPRVMGREFVVSLRGTGNAIVGAVELALRWDAAYMYPVSAGAVCVDRSGAIMFAQGKVAPGRVQFGILMPAVYGDPSELVRCAFNVVSNRPDLNSTLSIDGSTVYALDTSVIGTGAAVLDVQAQ